MGSPPHHHLVPTRQTSGIADSPHHVDHVVGSSLPRAQGTGFAEPRRSWKAETRQRQTGLLPTCSAGPFPRAPLPLLGDDPHPAPPT